MRTTALETYTGTYNWAEVLRQNPGMTIDDLPAEGREAVVSSTLSQADPQG